MRTRFTVLFIFTTLVSGACGKGSPTAPDSGCLETGVGLSCGTGPGPGPTVRATVSHRAYIGDCPTDPVGCSGELEMTSDPAVLAQAPGMDEVRPIRKGQTYTSRVCVVHPEVPGRKIDLTVGFPVGGPSQWIVFDEGNPAFRSPFCVGASFSHNTNGGRGGMAQFVEGRGDLREPTEIKIRFGFIVVE